MTKPTVSLSMPPVANTLERLHRAARGDWKYRLAVAPRWMLSRLTGHDFMPKQHTALSRTYSSVTPKEGRLLYIFEGPIDLLFLDGMKHLYLPMLDLVRERPRPGSIVVADNVDMPSARPYTECVRAPRGDFVSFTLFGGRMEVSLLGGAVPCDP